MEDDDLDIEDEIVDEEVDEVEEYEEVEDELDDYGDDESSDDEEDEEDEEPSEQEQAVIKAYDDDKRRGETESLLDGVMTLVEVIADNKAAIIKALKIAMDS